MSAPPSSRKRPRVVIIGAGPGGLCMGIKLRAAGFEDFMILEQAAGVGGTWWHNRYPGAACDVPSHLYSFSFELKRDWSSPYASAPEILAYLQHCAEKYALLPHVRFHTTVTAARWQDASHCWRIETAAGEQLEADVLVAAQGMFNAPSWPEIPGREDFRGHAFHTARWDHACDMRGTRVGLIGSAASAVQCAPEIARDAARLVMFQRTPNWVLPKQDEPYTAEKLAYLAEAPDAVEQRRVRLWQEFDGFALVTDPKRRAESVASGLANIAVVTDPVVRAKLTPTYAFGCKRVLLSSRYYPTFNLPHVEVVTDAIECITPTGVRTADGRTHACDVLVHATGFDVTRYLSTVQVTGRAGRTLDAAWHDGAEAYLGIATHGFPNLFQIYGPNTNKGSILFMIECQTAYIVRQLQRLVDERLAALEVRATVMKAYNDGIQRDARAIDVWAQPCHNYFHHPLSGRIVTQYPRPMTQYRHDTLRPDPEAYEVIAGT